jgi:hypothetical protein
MGRVFRFRIPGVAPGAALGGATQEPHPQPDQAMLPGGYDFIHIVFWLVVIPIIIGTNFMAITLSMGLGILVLEALKKN